MCLPAQCQGGDGLLLQESWIGPQVLNSINRTGIYSFGKEENDELCQSSNRTLVSKSLTKKKNLHEGGLRAQRPLLGPVLNAQCHVARLAFAIKYQNWKVNHTDQRRFTLSLLPSFRKGLDKQRGPVWFVCHRSVMVWRGTSMERDPDVHRLGKATLTAITYWDEILGLIVRPYTGAVRPGFNNIF